LGGKGKASPPKKGKGGKGKEGNQLYGAAIREGNWADKTSKRF